MLINSCVLVFPARTTYRTRRRWQPCSSHCPGSLMVDSPAISRVGNVRKKNCKTENYKVDANSWHKRALYTLIMLRPKDKATVLSNKEKACATPCNHLYYKSRLCQGRTAQREDQRIALSAREASKFREQHSNKHMRDVLARE